MTPLRDQLRAAGLDVSTLAPLRTEPEPLWELVVHGSRAVALWQRLRALTPQTGHYPLVLGAPDERSFLEEQFEFNAEPASDLIAQAAEMKADPRAWVAEATAEFSEQLAANGLGTGALVSDDELPHDEWPDDAEPQSGFTLPFDILSRAPHEEVLIALLPTTVPWHAPICVRFGGFNACPPPAQQGAMLRSWLERFGAEPVGISHDTMELQVERGPRTRDEALALAHEQYWFCNDVVDQGMGSIEALAASLIGAKSWYLWWD